MSRPRIRSLKPEMWQDEKIGGLSRDARLLFIGLITMADDEGRLRALPAVILGHVYPYDLDAVRKIAGWLKEIEASGLAQQYTIAGVPYVSLVGWRKHQKINRPTASDVPPPGALTEASVSVSAATHVPVTAASPLTRAPAPADRKGGEGKGTPLRPPEGGRARGRIKWETDAAAWARSLGFSAVDDHELVRAVRQAKPWERNGEAAEHFAAFVGQHFAGVIS